MANSIADELSRIPMSRNLADTLARATDYANSRNHREVTLEHLLLGLVQDPDAAKILASSKIDLTRLAAMAMAHLENAPELAPSGESRDVTMSAELGRILAAAAAATQQGRRSEISGAIVLAAIVGDATSAAAQLLRAQGLTFDEAIRALQREASAAARGAPPSPQSRVEAAPPLSGPDAIPISRVEPAPIAEMAASSQGTAPPAGMTTRAAPMDAAIPEGLGDVVPGRAEPSPPIRRAPLPRRPTTAWPNGAPRPPGLETPTDYAIPAAPVWRVEAEPLAYTIPKRMRTLSPVTIEARIPKAKVRIYAEGPPPPGAIAAKAMSVRLRAPGDDFWIELAAPETQWIDGAQGGIVEEFAVWRWTVTPKSRGRKRLQLLMSVRIIGTEGLVAQMALPDQTAETRVRGNFGRVVRTFAVFAMGATAGALIVMFGDGLLAEAQRLIAQFTSR